MYAKVNGDKFSEIVGSPVSALKINLIILKLSDYLIKKILLKENLIILQES